MRKFTGLRFLDNIAGSTSLLTCLLFARQHFLSYFRAYKLHNEIE